jgi:hypothetical protein
MIVRFLPKISEGLTAHIDPDRKELKMKRIIALGYGIIFLLISVGFSDAYPVSPEADITYVETKLGQENWQYEYIFTNASNPTQYAGFNLFEVDFSFEETVILKSYSLPSGWDIVAETGFANAFSVMIGIPPIGADIAPGTSLSGFNFQFNAQVGGLPFQAFFTDPYGGDPVLFEGTSVPVPLPSTILLLASGAIGLGLFRRKKFRK